MPENLMEGLQAEISRVKELVKVYENLELKRTRLTVFIINHSINNAEQAIANNNISNMVRCYSDLKLY